MIMSKSVWGRHGSLVRGGGLGFGGWGVAGKRRTRTPDPAATPPPHQGVKQWAAWGQDPFRNMEALLKYVHRHGYYAYRTRSYWLLIKFNKKSAQSIF